MIGREQINYHTRERYAKSRITHHDACNDLRKRSMIVCHMNKNKIPNRSENDDQEQSSKRGAFKRFREKISSSFGGNRKGNDSQNDEVDGGPIYKPTPLDAVRLRLAMAMSGISNLGLFQRRGNEEWVVACTKTKVNPGMIFPCTVSGLDIVIFASRDGQRLDAFANACPHLGSPFDLATVERKPALQDEGKTTGDDKSPCVDCIVCPVHRTAFEIESGQIRGEWCPYPPVIGNIMGLTTPKTDLVKFAVRLKGKNVEVRIATSVFNVGKGDEQADGIKGIK